MKYWWHNADRGRWFWEPTVFTLQQAPFEALDCPSVGVLRLCQARLFKHSDLPIEFPGQQALPLPAPRAQQALPLPTLRI